MKVVFNYGPNGEEESYVPHGTGTKIWANGAKYVGEWVEGSI